MSEFFDRLVPGIFESIKEIENSILIQNNLIGPILVLLKKIEEKTNILESQITDVSIRFRDIKYDVRYVVRDEISNIQDV